MEFNNVHQNSISRVTQLIQTRHGQIRWLRTFIKDVKAHELVVNVSKSVTTTATVVCTIMLVFPPTTIIGAAGLAGSGVVGAITSLADFIKNRSCSAELKILIQESREQEVMLQEALRLLETFIARCVRWLNMDPRVGEALDDAKGYGKPIGTVPLRVKDTVQIVPKAQQIKDIMNTGYNFWDASRIASAKEVIPVGLEVSVGGGRTIYQVSGCFVSNASKALAGIGAVVSVGDVIYSWANDNPNIKSAQKCLQLIENDLQRLETTLQQLMNLNY